MPTLHVITNVPGDRVTSSDVLKALSKALAKATGKPEQWVQVSLTADTPMMMGGSEEPCAFGSLGCIGVIGGDVNKTVSAAMCEVLSSRLKVPGDRIYIQFSELKASEIGWNGTTFA